MTLTLTLTLILTLPLTRLCDEDAALEAAGEPGRSEPLSQLAAFATAGGGPLGARRNAIAYMGALHPLTSSCTPTHPLHTLISPYTPNYAP